MGETTARQPKRGSQRGHSGSAREVLALRAQGLTLKEIGQRRGVSKQRIHQQIKALMEIADKQAIKEYRERLPDILAGAHARVLSYLVKPDVLAKASANNLAYAQTQLHTARRLEEGQSTSNVALHSLIETIERDERPSKEPANEQDR